MSEYRKAMGLRNTFGNDINWLDADLPKHQARPKEKAG